MNGKKWMTVLETTNWEWIKSTAAKAGVSGSFIINRLIGMQARNKSGEFESGLRQAKVEQKLRKLNDKKLAIAAEEEALARELKRDSKDGKVTTRV